MAEIPLRRGFGFVAPEKPRISMSGRLQLVAPKALVGCWAIGARWQRAAPFADDNWLIFGVALIPISAGLQLLAMIDVAGCAVIGITKTLIMMNIQRFAQDAPRPPIGLITVTDY